MGPPLSDAYDIVACNVLKMTKQASPLALDFPCTRQVSIDAFFRSSLIAHASHNRTYINIGIILVDVFCYGIYEST